MINIGDKFRVTQEYASWYKANYKLLPSRAIKTGDIVTITSLGSVYHGCDIEGVGYRILSADSFPLFERINE